MMFRRGSQVPSGQDWRSMETAPRDGTVVELCCTFGIAPWFGLFRWNAGSSSWKKADDPCSGVSGESTLHWRPTKQAAESYTDPTNGEQETREYWLRAAGL